MKKILILLTIPPILVIGGIVMMALIAGRDIPPPDTTDLKLERTELLPEQNAYNYFVSATNSLYWPTNTSFITDYLDEKPVGEDVIQEILSRNTNMMGIIGEGLECQRCLTPEITGFDTPLPYISSWMKMGKVMALKARHERLAGEHPEATRTCISLLRFGNIIQNDAEGIINYLVGISVLQLGLTQAQDLAHDQDIPLEDLKRLSEALATLGPFDRGPIRAIKGEYKMDANTIDRFRAGTFDWAALGAGETCSSLKGKRYSNYVFQPNKTKLTFANYYRDMIKNAPRPYAHMNRYDVEEVLGLKGSKAKRILCPNAIGGILLGALLPGLTDLLERKCRTECSVVATRLLAACNAYLREEGKLPKDLQALVPKYLSAIPNDPYDGQAFRYSPARGIVYSVGKDLKDSGGSSKVPAGDKEDTPSKRRWKAEDVVFEIRGKIKR